MVAQQHGDVIEVTLRGEPARLVPAQVAMLYALAESDWSALPMASLATRAQVAEERAAGLLAELAARGLVKPAGRGESVDSPVTLTEVGLRLITALTRRWDGWPDYRRRIRLKVY
jgi:hypothetical protein